MFNVAVFKMKDMVRYFVGITITVLIVIITTKYFLNHKTESTKKTNIIESQVQKILSKSYVGCIDTQISGIGKINEEKNTENEAEEETADSSYLKEFIKTEISSIQSLENMKNNTEENKENEETKSQETATNQETEEHVEQENQSEQQTQVELAKTGQKTEIITNNPIKESFNTQYGNVKIKNGTKINLTEEIMNPEGIKIDNKNVLIFHTHSCESYTSSDAFTYTPTGNYRTTDLNYTVTRVGTEFATQLQQYGINTIHNTDYHDYPAYNGSYTRSLQTVENILKTNPADIIIDLHRDAIGSRPDYAPIVKIGDDVAAQIMYVIGTNEGGLNHPNWQQNLKFAIKVQQKAEEMYPGLFKPLMLTEYRYNQHAGKYASIMEVGATGNTLEQCLNSMKYLARVLDEVMKSE